MVVPDTLKGLSPRATLERAQYGEYLYKGPDWQTLHNLFDEIDMLGYSRSKMRGEGIRGVVDQLLMEMEGVDSDNEGLLVIGATNMPWDVDIALRRPGRSDGNVQRRRHTISYGESQ